MAWCGYKGVLTTPQINYCGSYTTCTNLPGTYHCDTDTCYPGYGGWRANYGRLYWKNTRSDS